MNFVDWKCPADDDYEEHGRKPCENHARQSPEEILKEKFGYDSFRPLQREIIQNVLDGRDTLAIMPTGGGKSLCYQIPAMIFDGLTLVVSPLIALMQDQVAQLDAAGIPAVFLNSSLDREQYFDSVRKIRSGEAKIAYVSPEGLATERLRSLFREQNLSCITIDEAHCISEWGHDFRPDYRELSSFRAEFSSAVCLALTATATSRVRQDIMQSLNLKNPALLVASFNRKNITLSVRPKRDALFQVTDFLRSHEGECGIIYCFSRKQVDELTESLEAKGFSVLNYHAGLSDAERAEHQSRFLRDQADIMVATVAFGMGINKPNVRFVIHYDMPKSLEQYYQEIGRAGRDGNPAFALLLYSPADIRKIRWFFDENADSQMSERLLQGMIKYAEARSCRRQILLRYFGEDFSPQERSASCCCDLCLLGPVPQLDVTVPAQKFMSCVYRTSQKFGAQYVTNVLLGSRHRRILDNGHDKILTWGIGTEFGKEQWLELCGALEEQGFVARTGDYNVLSVTPMGKEALVSRKKIELPLRLNAGRRGSTAGNSSESSSAAPESAKQVFAALKTWRKMTAEELNVPPYIVLGDRSLQDLAQKQPNSIEELHGIYGIGRAKAQRWGAAICKVIAEFRRES